MTAVRPRPTESRASARLSAFSRGRLGACAGLAALACLAAVRPAQAATAQISKLQDVTFTAVNPLVSASASQSICVYSSTAGRGYSVRATGSGAGGAFTLSGGGGLTLAYGVQWDDASGSASGTALTAGVPLAGQTSSAGASTCPLVGTSATLFVSLAASDLQSALAGVSYTGTLSLLITPQ